MIKQTSISGESRLPMRQNVHLNGNHCFWTIDSPAYNEVSSKSSGHSTNEQSVDDGRSLCSGDSNEPSAVAAINLKRKATVIEQQNFDEDHFSSGMHSIENRQNSMGFVTKIDANELGAGAGALATAAEDGTSNEAPAGDINFNNNDSNRLVNHALEIAETLFGSDPAIVRGLHDGQLFDAAAAELSSAKQGDDTRMMGFPPQSSLLSRSNFSALEVLDAIYRDEPALGARMTRPTSVTAMQQSNKFRTNLKAKKSNSSASDDSEQSAAPNDAECMRQRQRELMDEYFHRSGDLRYFKAPFGRQGQFWADQKYYEYYEYLCKGIKRALSHPGSFDLDCGAGSVHTPSNQQANGICRAMKSNLYYQYSPGPEIYSRKVFVGGLPIDIDEDELSATFSRFGPLIVDWPNKSENKSYFPPKGYVFLIFEYEFSVRELVQSCFVEDEKLFLYISSPLSPHKLVQVQIRPWRLADADYVVEASIPIFARRAVFVGGVPRPIKAGAGRIAFTNQNSYMKAITDRYVQLSHGEVEKRVELKPYVLDDQPCDECGGERCGHRHAPFFCPQLSCLQYYCEKCWTTIHGCRAREDHKPLVKEA